MSSICSVLEDAASALPEKPLFVFPETRTRQALQLTYSQLAQKSIEAARAIAEAAEPGDRALLLFPTGPDFWAAFFGCLRQGIISVPLHTPNINRPSEVLQNVCNDCSPTLLITDETTAELLHRRRERHPYLNGIQVIVPEFRNNMGTSFRMTAVDASSFPALIQYTSGSTSRPRGVTISHDNLISNLRVISRQMEIRTDEDRGVTWLPHYHDMGLVGGYLATLYSRNTTLCLPPEEFAIRPARWLELISASRATVCGGPNFAYQLCADRVSDEDASRLDLSSWRVAYVGAERIRPEAIDRFTEKFSRAGFRRRAFFPCYGLAEATLMVTGGPASATPRTREVSTEGLRNHQVARPSCDSDITRICGSGRLIDGTAVVVISAESKGMLPDDEIGEVCISGPSVTDGYWRDLGDNRSFREVLRNGTQQRMLLTGDLGFLNEGELFITGRLKELIQIRGRNLYPEDIELQVRNAHPSVSQGAAVAFSVEDDRQEKLVIVTELNRSEVNQSGSSDAIVTAIRQRITECFGVSPFAILLARPGRIPHTSSGKPRRMLVREAWLRGEFSAGPSTRQRDSD
ncbi:MAG: fatty acyl-AMP ligase [Planctomyces sp.]